MNIAIVDDHPLFRSGVRNLIEATDDLTLLWEGSSGTEALRLAGEQAPDLILMDIRMPDMDGIEATRRIKESHPHIHVLILSMHKDDKSVQAVMKAGARGFLLKEEDGVELLQAIRMVGSGRAVFSPDIANRLAGYFEESMKPANSLLSQLTGREREVLEWLVQGDSNARIAQRLQLSVKTVANNVTNILNKLQVADRIEARRLVQSWDRTD